MAIILTYQQALNKQNIIIVIIISIIFEQHIVYLPAWQRHDEDMTTAVDWGSVQPRSVLATHLSTHGINSHQSIINYEGRSLNELKNRIILSIFEK